MCHRPAADRAAVAVQHAHLAGVDNTSRICIWIRYDRIGKSVAVEVCRSPLMAGFGCNLIILATDGTPALSVMKSM